jgi:DedD protein
MEDDGQVMRQRLLRRIALAGVIIVALVGSLAMFDAVFVNPPALEVEEPAPAVASLSVPPQEERGIDKPAEGAPETAPSAQESPAPAKPETPEPPKPDAPKAEASKSITKEKQEIRPITRAESKSEPKMQAVPEGTAAPSVPPPPAAPVVKQAQPPAQPHSPAPVAPAKPLAPGQGYLVQMGVFSNIANAEDLKSRLDKAGIPAHIEARVQVGPFKNKAEAEAAQKKLAEMGLSGLLLSPRK